MQLMLNNRDPRPLYEQVRDSLRTLIFNGVLAPDEKLPSVRELAKQLAINPNTIQRAYRELESLGMIYTVPGKGAFVEAGDAAAQQRKKELLADLQSTVRELHALGIPADEIVTAAREACDSNSDATPAAPNTA